MTRSASASPAPSGASSSSSSAKPAPDDAADIYTTTLLSGLQYTDIVFGTGPAPIGGQTCVVHYTGTFEDGKQFDSSRDKGQPFAFPLGAHKVILGWEQGVQTMHVGGRRKLVIPPQLAYGEAGHPPVIPPNSTLIFDVELLGIQ